MVASYDTNPLGGLDSKLKLCFLIPGVGKIVALWTFSPGLFWLQKRFFKAQPGDFRVYNWVILWVF